ncbi:MAG TPA: Spy/CpxP family protein refolding chaperone [Xanthobacteraceae bacterium]|jgi:hypothetical protein|nr:Spy/CpxP family protein refolding chaperone [Xanthobacteraceae bacterium]
MLKQIRMKPVLAGVAILAFAGSSYVFAQQGFGGNRGFDGDGFRFQNHHQMSAADMAAFTDARIAALKAGLQLTPDQAKNWPNFEQSLRDAAQLRMQRMQERQAAAAQPQQPSGSPFDRLAHRADNMAKTSAALKKVADAGSPLYASLNDDQKARFGVLSHMLRPHHRMHGFMGGHRFGQGYGNERDGNEGYGNEHDGNDGPGWRQRMLQHSGPRFGQSDDRGDDEGAQL